jgi:hypothetical protein
MPKRASTDDTIDPVRSRLAAAASVPVAPMRPAPVQPPVQSVALPEPKEARTEARREEVGQGGPNLQSRPRANPEPARPLRGTSLTINRKILVTPEEADRIEETTDAISAAFGSKVTYSQVSRAMWSILAGAEEAVRAGARRAPRLQVPSKGDHLGMAEYEQALADFLATALKRS